MIHFQSSVNPNDQFDFDNPKFGDEHTLNFKRINRTSRGNDLIISGEQGWTPVELMKWEWEYLDEDKRDKLKAFVARHVGIPVWIRDHYGVSWTVILLRPDAEFSQPGIANRALTLDMQIISGG